MKKELTPLSRDTEVPLHMQILEALERRIQSGELRDSDMLPSETTLMKQYEVSRITVRQALANLEQRGMIYRRQGLGTFVRTPHINQKLDQGAKTIVEALREDGIEPEVRVLGLQQVTAPPQVAEILGIDGEPVSLLRRVYLRDGVPIALVDLYLPLAMSGVGEVLCREDHLKETTYSVFERELNIKIKEAKHIIHSTVLDQEAADILAMEPGATCLTMDRITFSENGSVLEVMKYYYRADTFQFEITLPRDSDQLAVRMSKTSHSRPTSNLHSSKTEEESSWTS